MFPPPPWKKKSTYAQSCRLKRPIIRGRIVTREIVEEELKADRGETSSSGEDSLRAEREAETEKLAIERRRLLEYRAAQREMQSKFQEVFPDFNMVTHKAPSLNLSVASSELDPSSDDSSILSSLCSSHAEKELTKVSIMTPVAETENEQEDYSTDYSADEEISSIPNAVSFSNDMERSERSSQQESDRVEAGSDTETEDVVTPKIDRSSEIPMEIDETQDLAPEPTHPETTPLQTAPSNCVALKTAMRIGNLEVQNCQEVALPSSMVIIQNPETATSHVRIHMDKTPRCDATVGPEHCDSHQTGDSWSKVVESIVDSNVKCKEKGFEHPASEDAATAADVDEDNIKRPSDENVLTETNIAQGREPSGTLETKNQSSTSGSDSFRSEENFDFATKNLESATSKGGADHKRIAPCANDETELSKTFIVEGRCDSDPPAPSRSFLVEGPPQERLKSSSTQSLGSEVVARPATLTVTFDVSSIHAQTATAKTLIDESGPDAPRELKTVMSIKASQRGGVQRMRSIPEEGKSSAVRNRRRSTSLGPATSTPKIGETHTCSRYATHQAAYLLRKTSSLSSEPVTPKVIARKSLADHSQSYKRGGEKMKCLVEQSQALSVIAKEYESPASVPRNVHRTLSESGEFSIPSMPSTSRSSPVDRNPRKSPLPAAVNSRIPRPLSLLSVEGGSASVAEEHSARPTTPDLSDGDTRMIVREAKSGPIPRRGVALYLKGPEHARTRLRFEKEHCSHTSLPTEQSENAGEVEVEENGTMATPLEAHWQIAEVRRSRSYNSDVISTPLKHSDVGQSGEDKAKDNDDSAENHRKTLVSPTRDSAECNATILEEPVFDETVASTNTPNECSRTRLVFDTTFGSTFTSTDYTNANANFSSSLMPVTATNNEKPVVVLKKPEIVHPTPVAEASGLRRSSRNRVARLRHWLGERPEYRFNEEGNCELVGISTVKIRDRFLIENGTSSPRVALERAKQIKKSNVNRKLHRVGAKERKRQLIRELKERHKRCEDLDMSVRDIVTPTDSEDDAS